MKLNILAFIAAFFFLIGTGHAAPLAKNIKIDRRLTKEAKTCIECHSEKTAGIVHDWRSSRMAHAGVSCYDCHAQPKDYPSAAQNCTGVQGTDLYVSVLVTPKTCAKCHPAEEESFKNSGHVRAAKQIISKKDQQDLMFVYEGQNHAELKGAPNENGCMQCHGETIKLDDQKRPTASTWPNAGIGNIYPDGSTGNCATCHTRHKFGIAEARKPDACASCHLGPDHPQIEIFMSSKHGHVYKNEASEWNFDSPPDAWEPGDYRGPTCGTCHMSGIGDLKTTHNVSQRLYWNLWGKSSKPRNSNDPYNGLFGNAEQGRNEMQKVCQNCHTSNHNKNFFKQFDKQVKLYNTAYYEPAIKMLNDLKTKGLVTKNPWADDFQKTYYMLWHHDGRIMRMGAAMMSADYAHWHGSFKVMTYLYKLEKIYNKRIKTGKIE